MKVDYSNIDLTSLVNEYMHSDRNRKIILDRLVNGFAFGELAVKYHLTERQVQRIVKQADKLLVHIK